MAKLHHSAIATRDVEASLVFRRDRTDPPGADAPGPAEGFMLLSLHADLDTVLPRLAALGVGGEPTVTAVGPARLAVVRDPNGVRVELMDDVARRNLATLAGADG